MLPGSGPDQTASFLTQPTQHSMKIKYLSIMIDWGPGRLHIETFRDKFKSFVCKAGSETLIVNQSVLEMIFSLHCDQFMCCVMRRRETLHWGHWGQEIAGAHYLQERFC